jgi:hypothetical protein
VGTHEHGRREEHGRLTASRLTDPVLDVASTACEKIIDHGDLVPLLHQHIHQV